MSSSLVQGARGVAQGLYGVLVPGQPAREPEPREDSDDEGSQPEFQMAPPPDMAFDSREKLLEYLKNWAASQGYAVVIGRSRTNRLWIRCDRGGLYHDKHEGDPTQRQRKRKVSRLTGCEFSVKASMRKDGIWRSRTEHGEHNHGASQDLRDHPSLRRMNEEQLKIVYQLTENGLTPAEIMTELQRRWPDIKVIRRDIYNARKTYKSIKDANEEPPREFEDPNGKMPGPNDNGRWAWIETGDQIKKKRRYRKSDSVANTAQDSLNSMQLVAANDPYAANNTARSIDATPQNPEVTPSWGRLPVPASNSQSPAISPQASAFRPPPTSSSAQNANRIRSPQNDYSSNSASHQLNGATNSGFNFGTNNGPVFPQQILAPAMPNDSSVNSQRSSGPAQTRQSQRASAQTQIHPELRSYSANIAANQTASRQQPISQAPAQNQSQAQTQILSQLQQGPGQQANASRPAAGGGSSNVPSRPATSGMQTAAGEASGASQSGTTAAATGQPKPPISGALMMQRLQRVEEELKDQKTELRDQKSLLTEILAAVQSLKG